MAAATDFNLKIRALLDICKILMESGAEISKVEESALSLCRTFGINEAQVFVIPNYMTLSYLDGNDSSITKTLRFRNRGTNLAKMETALALVETVEGMPLNDVFHKIEEIKKRTPKRFMSILAYASVAITSTWLSHLDTAPLSTLATRQNLLVALIGALLCSSMLFAMDHLIAKTKISDVFAKLFEAVALALSAYFVTRLFQGPITINGIRTMNWIIIGNIMLVVPGIKFTNGIRSLFTSDHLSAIIQVIDAMFSTLGIALGIGATLYILLPWNTLPAVDSAVTFNTTIEYIAQLGILSGLSSLGFALYFNFELIPARVCFSALGGMFTAVTRYIAMVGLERLGVTNDTSILFISVAIAAMVAAVFGWLLEKWARLPKIVFIFTAIIPLVPGGKLYQSIYNYLDAISRSDKTVGQALASAAPPMSQALITAAGIAFGIVILSVLLQLARALVSSLDYKQHKMLQIAEKESVYKHEMDLALQYFQIGMEWRINSQEEALKYFKNAKAVFDPLVEAIMLTESKQRYDVLNHAALNEYWIYRMLEYRDARDEDPNKAAESLQRAKELYGRANSLDQHNGKGNILNWIAALEIAEVRNVGGNQEKFDSLIGSSRSKLIEAEEKDFFYAPIHINKAETYIAEMLFDLGLHYMEPLYRYHETHTNCTIDKEKLKGLAKSCSEELDIALACESHRPNAYYKHGQLHALLSLIATDDQEREAERERGEAWFTLMRYHDEHNLSYLYTYRQFCECFDIEKAKRVNVFIREHNKRNADAWEKAIKAINDSLPA